MGCAFSLVVCGSESDRAGVRWERGNYAGLGFLAVIRRFLDRLSAHTLEGEGGGWRSKTPSKGLLAWKVRLGGSGKRVEVSGGYGSVCSGLGRSCRAVGALRRRRMDERTAEENGEKPFGGRVAALPFNPAGGPGVPVVVCGVRTGSRSGSLAMGAGAQQVAWWLGFGLPAGCARSKERGGRGAVAPRGADRYSSGIRASVGQSSSGGQ